MTSECSRVGDGSQSDRVVKCLTSLSHFTARPGPAEGLDMANRIENQIVVTHYPRQPFGRHAGIYSIETRVGSENCEGDPGPLSGCTLNDPLSDADKDLLCRLALARFDAGGRFALDYLALRGHLRAVCGVRDEDLHGLAWGTIIAMLQERGRLARKREIAHSDDFRSVCWFGTNYSFTSQQAEVVRILWQAYKAQTPDVDAALLLSDFTGCAAHRVRDLFRKCPAWKTMIVLGGSRGTYRLQSPK